MAREYYIPQTTKRGAIFSGNAYFLYLFIYFGCGSIHELWIMATRIIAFYSFISSKCACLSVHALL